MKFLFIGNSHTFKNDMPYIFQCICEKNSVQAETFMLAHSGKTFEFHSQQPEVRFNILYGHYDYIILQDRQKDFSAAKVLEYGMSLDAFISQTSAKKVLYMTWTIPQERELQVEVARGYYRLGQAIGATVAPVGLLWWDYVAKHPEDTLFAPDNRHATPAGSTLAAYTIFQTIFGKPAIAVTPEEAPIATLVAERLPAYRPTDFIK